MQMLDENQSARSVVLLLNFHKSRDQTLQFPSDGVRPWTWYRYDILCINFQCRSLFLNLVVVVVVEYKEESCQFNFSTWFPIKWTPTFVPSFPPPPTVNGKRGSGWGAIGWRVLKWKAQWKLADISRSKYSLIRLRQSTPFLANSQRYIFQ